MDNFYERTELANGLEQLMSEQRGHIVEMVQAKRLLPLSLR